MSFIRWLTFTFLVFSRPDAVFNIVRDLDKLVKKAQEAYGAPGVAYV